MLWWGVFALLLMIGCEHATELPAVPPPPEDLSTWTVPELVQPPPPVPQTQQPPADKPTAAEKVVPFAPGTTVTVSVPVGWPLDIVLERGEQVRNIVGGDRAPTEASQTPRWEVKEGAEGHGETLRPHVFVTTTEPGLTTGLIITTTKRAYYITCKSVQTSPTRVLRWQYPATAAELAKPAAPPRILSDPAQPAQYYVGYSIESQGRVPDWMPRGAWDNGKKLYIVYPEVTLFGTVPLLRLLGPNGPQLVNARQVLNVLIVDQLVARAELRVGVGEHAETVTITRGTLRTITCPGDEACPVWPAAAAALAGRQP